MGSTDASIEKLLCCNVLTSDEYSQPDVFRHPFYTFEGPLEWPPPEWKTARCLYCAHPFDRPGENGERIPAPPVPLPCFHDKRTGQWRVSGIYCSWNCAKAELLHTQGYACGGGALLVEQMARKVFGYTGSEIAPAPPKNRLSFFYAGPTTLSIDEFRQESETCFTVVVTPPLLSSPEIYERHALPKTATTWTVKGIRAKGHATSPAPNASEHESKDGHGPEEANDSMFSAFMRQKVLGEHELQDAMEEDHKASEGGGTLMDWRDPTASHSTRGAGRRSAS